MTTTPHRSSENRAAAWLSRHPAHAGSMPIERRTYAVRRLLELPAGDAQRITVGARYRSEIRLDDRHLVGLLLVAQGRSLAYVTEYLDVDNRSVYRWLQRAQEYVKNGTQHGQGQPSPTAEGTAGHHSRGPEQNP